MLLSRSHTEGQYPLGSWSSGGYWGGRCLPLPLFQILNAFEESTTHLMIRRQGRTPLSIYTRTSDQALRRGRFSELLWWLSLHSHQLPPGMAFVNRGHIGGWLLIFLCCPAEIDTGSSGRPTVLWNLRWVSVLGGQGLIICCWSSNLPTATSSLTHK